MALVVTNLQAKLSQAFTSMTDGDNSVFADKLAKAVKDYAESGTVTTIDAGTISAGMFTGSGTGGITCDDGPCDGDILDACEEMNDMTSGGNEHLAKALAAAIDAMTADGTVKTTVSGSAVPPSGGAVPVSGKAEGTMAGVPAPMEALFLSTFLAMNDMKSGGDGYLAAQMASAVDAYLKACTVSTNGQGPLSGSTGVGKTA
jgi:hypothetical protein